MRIEDPEADQECRNMAMYLDHMDKVDMLPLDVYIGSTGNQMLLYSDLTTDGFDELDGVLDVYVKEFSDGPTSVPRDIFKNNVLSKRYESKPYAYHLFSIKRRSATCPEGMMSFLTYPGFGFGGYMVFDHAIRRRGHLSEVITVVEKTMMADKKDVRGWYAECDPADESAPIFMKRGFHEIDVMYRQPPLSGRPAYGLDEAPVLHLLYKEFGEHFAPPRLTAESLLEALKWLFRYTYRIDSPEASEYFQDIKEQVQNLEYVKWK
jgi:hypothetical protein